MKTLARHITTILSVIILAACTAVDGPPNLEPKLILFEAADITRTEATVAVMIDNHGTGSLSYVQFAYCGEDGVETISPYIEIVDNRASWRFSSLTPNTSYAYRAVGKSSTATITSTTLSFTTIPNNRPTVSGIRTLSSGPVGVVVEYEIVDDGGENLMSAGCEVVSVTSPTETRRQPLADNELTPGLHTLYITGLDMNTSYYLSAYASNSMGEVQSESIMYTTTDGVKLNTPGELTLLFGDTPITMTSLSIAGEMNGDDFRFLRYISGANTDEYNTPTDSRLSVLNLADAKIVEGGGSYDGSRFTAMDILTKNLLCGCNNLTAVILPNGITEIERDAMADCRSLATIEIPASVTTILPSSGCQSLRAITVSDGNPRYSAVDGVLYDKKIAGILWFPMGKTGHYVLPATVTEIGENAFADTSISSITIESTVTRIHRGAFAGSAIEEITMPDKLTNLAEATFQNCASLKTVRLGASIEFIGDYAFDGTDLTSLYVGAEIPPYVNTNAFKNSSKSLFGNCRLYVPSGTKSLYRNHSTWKQFNYITEF